MMNKIYKMIIAVLVVSSLFGCGGNVPAETTDQLTDVTDVPIVEKHFFTDDTIMFTDGMYSNIDGDKSKVILSEEKFASNTTFDFKFSFESKSARLEIFTDVRKDSEGSITAAHKLMLDALNGRIALYEVKDGENTLLGYAKYPFVKDTEYLIRLGNLRSSISVYFGTDEIESAPIINVSCTRLPSSEIGISFCGGTKAGISAPVISETVAPAEGDRYINPMLTSTVIADPTVLLYDGTYYMFTTGSFVCRVSTDLVNWQEAGAIADKTKLYGTKYFGGAGIYERDGKFYLLYTSHKDENSGLSVFYATSDKVRGPYTQEGTLEEHMLLSANSPAGSFIFNDPVSGKDILYFYRTDPGVGNVLYATNVEVKDGKITVLDKSPTKLAEPTEAWEMKKENGVSTPVCERPNVIYHEGYYYVFYAGSHYKTSYSEGYIVSDKPMEGFIKPKDTNPLLDATASITGVGCTWIVPSTDGSELFVLYHCHDAVDSFRARRLCMDRLTFRKNSEGGPDIPVIHGPTVTYQPAPSK